MGDLEMGQTLEKLMADQQDLVAEEEFLQKLINKLNTQAHALQVEQFHILNLINKNSKNDQNMPKKPAEDLKKEVDLEKQELDLTVPRYQSFDMDEEEIEEIEFVE